MPHSAKILLDSVCPHGHRLTSFELKFPRIVLSEQNTHRQFNRSSASSRAIPIEKMVRMVLEDPYIPIRWDKNQAGMQAAAEILGEEALECEREWLHARDNAVYQAQKLLKLGVHKQLTNRLLECFMWQTVINTATEYSNYFALRDHPAAHPDMQIVARLAHEAYKATAPTRLYPGQWHLPYQQLFEDLSSEEGLKVTTGRCARVSYLNHDGNSSAKDDMGLHDRVLSSGHMGPLEHPARVMHDVEYHEYFRQPKMIWDKPLQKFIQVRDSQGNLVWTHFCGPLQGWVQYRKHIPHEEDFGALTRSLATAAE